MKSGARVLSFFGLSIICSILAASSHAVSVVRVDRPIVRVGNYACPAACPGPRGPYETSCSGSVCLSNPFAPETPPISSVSEY